MRSTERGFVNRNRQKNNGRTQIPGTDNQQWFYEMECLGCGINIMPMEVISGKGNARDAKEAGHNIPGKETGYG